MTHGDPIAPDPQRATKATETAKSKSATATVEGAGSGPEGMAEEKRKRTATVNLPFMTAEFRAPDFLPSHLPNVPHPSLSSVPLVGRVQPLVGRVSPLVGRLPRPHVSDRVPRPHVPDRVPRPHVPSRRELGDATRVVGSYLPERDRLALFAGLGAVAVTGVIDWPVAAAVAAGTFVKHGRRSEDGPSRAREIEQKPEAVARRTPAKAAGTKTAPAKTAPAKSAPAKTARAKPARPKTAAPETAAPEPAAPETGAPETGAPETAAPPPTAGRQPRAESGS